MRVLIYASGVTGSGRFVAALAVALALKRAGLDSVRILSSHPFSHLAEVVGVDAVQIPREGPRLLATSHFPESALYDSIMSFAPELLIVVQSWYAVQTMSRAFPFPTLLLLRNASNEFFRARGPDGSLTLDVSSFYGVIATEPYDFEFPVSRVPPLILRNRSELLERVNAAEVLGIDPERPTALVATNGEVGEFDVLRRDYSYLENEYQVVYSSNHRDGLFPAVDYYEAIDFLVCGAGYNQFWEAQYFAMNAHFVPQPRRYEDQYWRVEKCQGHRFSENGADVLAARIIRGTY